MINPSYSRGASPGAAIEGVSRQRTGEALERIAVDTHGFTFFGMGLSKGLGFDLCPRLRGIKQQLHVQRGKLDFPVRQYQDRLLSKKARNLGPAIL